MNKTFNEKNNSGLTGSGLIKTAMLFLLLIVFQTGAFAAPEKLTGKVTSASDQQPLPGVTVVVTGGVGGTVTDIDGKYTINVEKGQNVVFSFVGYKSQTVPYNGQAINVALVEDSQSLDEVVVIGYGVQKKKLVTGATVQVAGDDLAKLNTTSALNALQSQSPGVNIVQSSGQPGSGYNVYVRGLGTTGSSAPLYVIDGVAGGDLNNLNPADIESIDVLKDAASAAIYGARAANGVILVTTKQGKSGKVSLSYDGYYGAQYCYKMPDLTNAKEYMALQDRINFNEKNSQTDWAASLPADLYKSIVDGTWTGTDWMKASYNKAAPIQNHAINLIGGNDISKFSMGFSYTQQEGIFGKPVQSEYDRYTIRMNSEHVLLKNKDFDIIKVGENVNYTYRSTSGISTGNIYWNAIHGLLVANPLLPVTTEDGAWYDNDVKSGRGWSYDSQAANPIATTALSSQGLNLSKNHNLNASGNIQIQPIKNLIFKSQFGYKMSASSFRSMEKKSNASTIPQTFERVDQNESVGYSWTLDNTISYKLQINDHVADVVLGQSAEKWGMGDNVAARGTNTIFAGSWENAYVSNTKTTTLEQISAGVSGAPWGSGSLASFFGRVNYNYKEKYLASFTMRADGSSNFAPDNRWGYFPSASLGWVVSSEPFMETTQNWLDFFKIRASWGQNGNCSISAWQYLTSFQFDVANGYYFGKDKATQSTGGYASVLANPDVKWETSEQLDLGFDARFLSSRLGVAFDWYNKKTKDWLVAADIQAVYGFNAPFVNGGDVENKGFELALNWNDNAGDFTYGVNLNMAYNKNEVTRIDNSEGIIHGPSNVLSQGTGEMYRAQVNYPIGYFWGYKTDGVIQNSTDLQDYLNKNCGGTVANSLQGKSLQAGDLKFVDVNGDGVIDEKDKTDIGNPHPDYTVGFSFNVGYKGLDLSVTTAGAFGHQIAKSYRSFADSRYQNFTTDMFDTWHGDGTSNHWPRLTSGSNLNWQTISDIYMEDADYVKIQNVTLGYDFKKLFPRMPLQQARLYVTAQNLYTFTKYSGMDPEVGYSPNSWGSGIDLGFYPSPRTYMVGVNLKF